MSGRCAARTIAALLLAWSIVSGPGAGEALADGAFPDSVGLFVGQDQSAAPVLATNFGLISRMGASGPWSWSCETGLADLIFKYAPADSGGQRYFGLSFNGLMVTDDLGCSWSGLVVGAGAATDLFVDPDDPAMVFTIGFAFGDGVRLSALFVSNDGGRTSTRRFTAPLGTELLSVESSRSGQTWYLAGRDEASGQRLWRSDDHGLSWNEGPVVAGIGALRIITIDPRDPRRVWLRYQRREFELLLLTTDGGATVVPISGVNGRQVGAVLDEGGALFLATGAARDDGRLQRISPAGELEATMTLPFTPAALAGAGGMMYAVPQGFPDGVALYAATVGAWDWSPFLRLSEVSSVRPCFRPRGQCGPRCDELSSRNVRLGPSCEFARAELREGTDAGVASPSGVAGGEPAPACGLARAPASAPRCLPAVAALLAAWAWSRHVRSRRR